jgi:hypothetical protein
MQIGIQQSYKCWQFADMHIDVTAVYSTYVDRLLMQLSYLNHRDVLKMHRGCVPVETLSICARKMDISLQSRID